jgi:hypothetical protein
LVALNAYLGTIATSSRPLDGTPFKDFTIAANQLQLVVEPGTAAKIEKLVAGYTKLHLALLARYVPVLHIQNNIEYWVGKSKETNIDHAYANGRVMQLRSDLLKQQVLLMAWLIDENKRLSPLRYDALSAVRRDMFADGDLSEVQNIFEQEWEQMRPLFDEIFKAVGTEQ